MYIEGNALILGDSSYLEHHGILGQKWGVRRFQNKDGTRTAAGKARDQKKAAKSVALSTHHTRNSWQYQNAFTKAQDKVINDSKSAVRKMAADALYGERKAEYKAAVEEYDAATNYRYDEYRKESAKYEAIAGMACGQRYPTLDPAKFDQDTRLKWDAEFYMYDDGDQGKYNSYDYFLVAKGENPNKVFDRAMKARDNIESIAKKDADDILGDSKDQVIKGKVKDRTVADELAYQITEMATSLSDYTMVWEHGVSYTDNEIKQMKEDIKKYSKEAARLGLTHSAMFIEDGTLYLSHHGIRGQRWGVRRFQNRDGSLTNAGRKRLGYATKGAAQTVGKAFKAGVKAGGNAVKAVKAHHEKKEAEKLQKKKEKASKTRLGVMANKDLFTNEEIRKLNERFKLEDEMKMATLQKGVEIAKAVGTIAQNVGTVAKTYEDVTGQSLSPIKRKAAEEKARQDKEDRERRIAREDADEARKAAKEERDIAIHEQTLRKAIASADTQEFTAQKTKAEADSSILDLYKKGQDFNGGSDATGQSWMEKAKSGGKNPFDDMIADRDPEYAQIRKEHEEKVARKERMAELDRREKEREAEKAAASRPKQQQQKQNNDDALFSQKGSLPLDKDRYRNNRAMEKAKQVKEDAAEERAKKQDEKAAKATIDDMMEARRQFTESARTNSNGAFDRETAANYIKGKAKELPSKLNPINAIAKKITNKALKEEEDNARKALENEYKKASRSQGRDEANYTMYYNRVSALQSQGYSERQAKKVADTESPFSSKRNRRFEYNEKIGELEATHRKNAKEIDKANKELTDYYYKLVNGPGYDPGTPKREALDRKYAQKRGELERLEKDNNDMLDRETKKAKKILEHSFSIQNGVLFIDESVALSHHGVKGQRWGVRRFQNEDGTLTEKGRKHYEKAIAKEKRKQVSSDAIRGTLERQHPFAVAASVALGATYAAMLGVASAAAPGAVVAGAAIAAAISGVGTHGLYSVSEAWEGRGTRMRSKKIAKYESMLKQSSMEEGMYHVENGTLFIEAGEPYLEHHGVLGMKWGKHLRAGKGPADAPAGGGGGEDDEKLKEMAKKAGMSVAEYKQKFASKIGGAASKVGEKVYDAAGGKYKKEARELYKAASREDRVAEEWKREQSALRGLANRKREAAKAWDNEAKSASAAAKTANNVAIKAGSTAKAYSERAKARKEAAAKAKVPKMSRDPNTPNPFGSTGVREQDDKINSWADDINRNNKMTRSGWKRKMNYEQPKKEFEKAAQDIHNGKKNVTLSEGAAAYALAREQQAVRRRRHSATIGSGDEKKAKELNGIKREMEESGAIARRAQQSAKKNRDRLNDSARMDASSANTSGLLVSNHNKYGRRKRADAKEAQSKYEKSLAGKYDRLKAKRNKKSVKKKASRLRKARHLLPKLKHSDNTNAVYTEGTRLVINSKWG